MVGRGTAEQRQTDAKAGENLQQTSCIGVGVDMRGRLGRCVGLWERVGGAEDRVSHENLVARQLEQQLWLFPCRWVGWTKKL